MSTIPVFTVMSRLRFSSQDDLILLREVIAFNPFMSPDNWKAVHENTCTQTKKNYTIRAVKEHLEHLLKTFMRGDCAILKRSATEEEYKEKLQMLQECVELRKYTQKQKYQPIKADQIRGCEIQTAAGLMIDNVKDEAGVGETVMTIMDTGPTVLDTPSINVINFESQLQQDHISISNEDPLAIPTRQGTKRTALESLIERKDSEKRLRERELDLEERKIALEERKIALEEARLELQREEIRHKHSQEQKELEYRARAAEEQQKLVNTLLEQLFKKS